MLGTDSLNTFRQIGKKVKVSSWVFWASLVAQLIKNPPAMWETWVGKIPWRRERLPTPVFWPGEFHGLYIPGVTKSWTRLSAFHPLTFGPWFCSACHSMPKSLCFIFFVFFAFLALHCSVQTFSSCGIWLSCPATRGILFPWPGT